MGTHVQTNIFESVAIWARSVLFLARARRGPLVASMASDSEICVGSAAPSDPGTDADGEDIVVPLDPGPAGDKPAERDRRPRESPRDMSFGSWFASDSVGAEVSGPTLVSFGEVPWAVSVPLGEWDASHAAHVGPASVHRRAYDEWGHVE